MKMKAIRMLGTLAMTAAVAMVVGACSSDDNLVDNGADNGSTAARSVTVTVGAGIADDAATRSAVVNGTDAETGKPTRTLKFTAGDKLYVHCKIDNKNYKSGMLTMVGEPTNDGKNATFSGEMTAYKKYNEFIENDDYDFGEDPLDGTTATLVHEGMKSKEESEEDADYYISINGGKIYFSKTYANDVETLMTKRLQVTGDYVSGSGYTLTAGAIFNCTFTGLEAETDYLLRLHYPVGNGYYSGTTFCNFTTDENGTGTVAFTPDYTDNRSWEINLSKYANNNTIVVGTISLGERAFEAGKVYNLRRHWNGEAFEKTIPLETVSSAITVPDGYTLTGELKSKVKISIADGATVTLAGVTIDGMTLNSEDSWDYNWAGLTCLGNAHIVLNGENTVTSFYSDYPGIQAGPKGTTLTISGSGKLTAKGKNYGAGIGGGYFTCGDITISGGDITASSLFGAGIGSGVGNTNTCGAITINGGTVTASSNEGACIGSGQQGTCGDITISAYKVMAESTSSGVGIGCGEKGHCGDITISAGEDFVSLTAKKGSTAHRPIGLYGNDDEHECGKITLFGTVIYDPNDTQNGKDDKEYNCDDVGMNWESKYNTWIFKPDW
jgi:hypothetical protein